MLQLEKAPGDPLPSRRRFAELRNRMLLESLEPRVLLTTTPAYAVATLASFTGTGGAAKGTQPSGLIMAPNGDLYGTTSGGGAKGFGTIFKIAAGTSTVVTLATFTGKNGAYPIGDLVLDAQGDLFGSTEHGGTNDKGSIFELFATSSTITTLASFDGANGIFPLAGVVADANGDLFGTTFGTNGLPGNHASVFELAASSNTITALATFPNGIHTLSSLVVDSSGNIFGTLRNGGTAHKSAIFEISASSSTLTILASFKGPNGQSPVDTLVEDSNGNLFGITTHGGAKGKGSIFELNATSSTITTLGSFGEADGSHPVGKLILDSNGNFFGTTAGGGTSGFGTVFELFATASTPTTIFSFKSAHEGINPRGPLVMDADGNFYGTTFFGGARNFGVLFELIPSAAPQVPVKLVLQQQPTGGPAGQTLAPPLVVEVEDAFNRVDSAGSDSITVMINSGPDGANLSGTLTVPAIDGVATFSDLSLDLTGKYTLTVTDGVRTSLPTHLLNMT